MTDLVKLIEIYFSLHEEERKEMQVLYDLVVLNLTFKLIPNEDYLFEEKVKAKDRAKAKALAGKDYMSDLLLKIKSGLEVEGN